MSRMKSLLVIVALVLVGGCGGGATSASTSSAPSSSTKAEAALRQALTQVGLTVCPPRPDRTIPGEVSATTFPLGPCRPAAASAMALVRLSAYRSAAARAAGLKVLA